MNHRLIHGDCENWLQHSKEKFTCIFADPPDNIGLDYGKGAAADRRATDEYVSWLRACLALFVRRADIVWLSHNVKWNFHIGRIVLWLIHEFPLLQAKPCVQVFTFGQHNQHDLGNNHRSLLRLKHKNAPLYPDQIRVESWRQAYGDKRADSRGRVPGDVFDFSEIVDIDGVFDFSRVVGNSKQKRKWCPTQLNEGLVERCIKLSTKEGDTVLDPFAGTGTTLRVCERINRHCTLIESNQEYCKEIAKEHKLWAP